MGSQDDRFEYPGTVPAFLVMDLAVGCVKLLCLATHPRERGIGFQPVRLQERNGGPYVDLRSDVIKNWTGSKLAGRHLGCVLTLDAVDVFAKSYT
jgi:hypothetical protein